MEYGFQIRTLSVPNFSKSALGDTLIVPRKAHFRNGEADCRLYFFPPFHAGPWPCWSSRRHIYGEKNSIWIVDISTSQTTSSVVWGRITNSFSWLMDKLLFGADISKFMTPFSIFSLVILLAW